jgi:hypothetical protein
MQEPGRPALFVGPVQMARILARLLVVVAVLGCSPRFDWREVRSATDAYAVSLPGKPQIVTRDLELPLAAGTQKVSMTMTSSGVGPTMFAVGVAHLPPGVPQDTVQASMAFFRDGLLRNIGVRNADRETTPPPGRIAPAMLRASTSFEAHGQLGRPGEKPEPARLAARIYVVDDRLYQVVVMGRAADLPDHEIETFFTSFQLTSQ